MQTFSDNKGIGTTSKLILQVQSLRAKTRQNITGKKTKDDYEHIFKFITSIVSN